MVRGRINRFQQTQAPMRLKTRNLRQQYRTLLRAAVAHQQGRYYGHCQGIYRRRLRPLTLHLPLVESLLGPIQSAGR